LVCLQVNDVLVAVLYLVPDFVGQHGRRDQIAYVSDLLDQLLDLKALLNPVISDLEQSQKAF
jgi:hypothetical protein